MIKYLTTVAGFCISQSMSVFYLKSKNRKMPDTVVKR